MSKWSDYYAGRIGDSYPDYCRTKYKSFLHALKEARMVGRITTFREEGCGIATFSKILAKDFGRLNISAFDKDLGQCINAKANTEGLDIKIFNANILDYVTRNPNPDVIFSHGVLEHFKSCDIEIILDRQRSQAKTVVHYVPTSAYKTPSFGDENLMSPMWWDNNFEPSHFIVDNAGKDLVLVWEQ